MSRRRKATLAAQRDAWAHLQIARAHVRGHEIVFLKALGWEPMGDVGNDAEALIAAGEPVRWHRWVRGESFDQDEAIETASGWWIADENARSAERAAASKAKARR